MPDHEHRIPIPAVMNVGQFSVRFGCEHGRLSDSTATVADVLLALARMRPGDYQEYLRLPRTATPVARFSR